MSEKRYEVTEGQLLSIIKEAWVNGVQEGETGESELSIAQMLEDLKATLTPDPEPSGEVVERAKTWLQWRYEEHCRGDDKFVRLADAQALLTAEVTRQVEERTRGYIVALKIISGYGGREQAACVSRDIARQALANKGGSDE